MQTRSLSSKKRVKEHAREDSMARIRNFKVPAYNYKVQDEEARPARDASRGHSAPSAHL